MGRTHDLFSAIGNEKYALPTVTQEGVNEFRVMVDDFRAMMDFFSGQRHEVLPFLTALTQSASDGVTLVGRALRFPNAVYELCQEGDAGEVLDLMALMDQNSRLFVLSTARAIEGLCDASDNAQRVYDMLMTYPQEQRNSALNASGADKALAVYLEEKGMADLRRGPATNPTTRRNPGMPG